MTRGASIGDDARASAIDHDLAAFFEQAFARH
jgi:hypothetical protein